MKSYKRNPNSRLVFSIEKCSLIRVFIYLKFRMHISLHREKQRTQKRKNIFSDISKAFILSPILEILRKKQ